MKFKLFNRCLFRKKVDHISVFKSLLRKYEAAAADKKDVHSQELMKTLDLITDPKIKLEVSIPFFYILIKLQLIYTIN